MFFCKKNSDCYDYMKYTQTNKPVFTPIYLKKHIKISKIKVTEII